MFDFWEEIESTSMDELTCTNPELHAQYSDRGIEDQCSACLLTWDRVQS